MKNKDVIIFLGLAALVFSVSANAGFRCRPWHAGASAHQAAIINLDSYKNIPGEVISDYYGNDFSHRFLVEFKRATVRVESNKSKGYRKTILSGKYYCIEK